MDHVIASGWFFSARELKVMNWCRLYLQAVFISDLANVEGTHINAYMNKGEASTSMPRVAQLFIITLFKIVHQTGVGLSGGKRVYYGVLSMGSYERRWDVGKFLRQVSIVGYGQYILTMKTLHSNSTQDV